MSPEQQLEHVRQWRTWMQTEADRLVELACHTELCGGGPWDEAMDAWGVSPLSVAERQRHATSGPPRSSGPPPIEVRMVVDAVAEFTLAKLAEFDRTHRPDTQVDTQLDRVRYDARDLADNMLRRFLGRVRPKTTTASIFANARASKGHLQGASGPGVSTLCCPACGAPRQAGATSRTCEFCGTTY